jgi:TRAP-type uncharacterized transport system fused permease subunit
MAIRKRETWIKWFIALLILSLAPFGYYILLAKGLLSWMPPVLFLGLGKALPAVFLGALVIATIYFYPKLNKDEKTLWIMLIIPLAVLNVRALSFYFSLEVSPASRNVADPPATEKGKP